MPRTKGAKDKKPRTRRKIINEPISRPRIRTRFLDRVMNFYQQLVNGNAKEDSK